MSKEIYQLFSKNKNQGIKQFAVLIDADQSNNDQLIKLIEAINSARVDYIFVGGSLAVQNSISENIDIIKKYINLPIILFPGSSLQISDHADGIFFLSLISGRNPELLIGQHVIAAPILKANSLEVIPTGYILVDGGRPTAVSYMSNTTPVPADKDDIAMCTAIAGELLGLKVLYMDAGSGAATPISESMIKKVSMATSSPLIVGGGIKTAEKAIANCKAGADIIVVGDAIEKDVTILTEISEAIHSFEVVSNFN